MKKIELRDYQKECIEEIEKRESGNYLITMATGLGKTVIFSHLHPKGKMLILSHRDELVNQPVKYFEEPCGIEEGPEVSHGENVVSASVQSLKNRLDKFSPEEFDILITDEAHHATADTYMKIYDYFKPRLHLGFTATPNRADNVGLKKVYDEIIYNKDLKSGIKDGWLSDIECYTVEMGYDLDKVKKSMGDFSESALTEKVDNPKYNEKIGAAYLKHAKGQTLIFCASVQHAHNVSKYIKGSVVVSAKTPKEERKRIIQDFTDKKIPCLINCLLFTEGTDIPLVETVIIARPTMNQSLYTQMVGRGLRKAEGKDKLILIDCVGVSKKLKVCTAPNLFGLDTSHLTEKEKKSLEGKRITELEDAINLFSKSPKYWIVKTKRVDLFNVGKEDLDFKNINWNYNDETGELRLALPKQQLLWVTSQNKLGESAVWYKNGETDTMTFISDYIDVQDAINTAYTWLVDHKKEERAIWDLTLAKKWGKMDASKKQKDFINQLLDDEQVLQKYPDIHEIFDDKTVDGFNKSEASIVIDSLKNITSAKKNNINRNKYSRNRMYHLY